MGNYSMPSMKTFMKRGQVSFVIPAWKVGDRVEHKVSGMVGTVKEFLTQGHELVKVRLDGRTMLTVIHASDLVVHEAGMPG